METSFIGDFSSILKIHPSTGVVSAIIVVAVVIAIVSLSKLLTKLSENTDLTKALSAKIDPNHTALSDVKNVVDAILTNQVGVIASQDKQGKQISEVIVDIKSMDQRITALETKRLCKYDGSANCKLDNATNKCGNL